jgi:hypothetical protein
MEADLDFSCWRWRARLHPAWPEIALGANSFENRESTKTLRPQVLKLSGLEGLLDAWTWTERLQFRYPPEV